MTEGDNEDRLRLVALADCVCYALAAFGDQKIYDQKSRKMIWWKSWFRDALREAGFGHLPQCSDGGNGGGRTPAPAPAPQQQGDETTTARSKTLTTPDVSQRLHNFKNQKKGE